LIVGVSVAIRYDDYGSEQYCWISTSHGTLWSFIGPVLAVIAANLYVFCRIMWAVLRARRRVKSRRATNSDEAGRQSAVMRGLRASVSFMCLLGVTWVFGALAIGDAAVVFMYLFTLCNVVQGIFIFVFHFALDQK
jgi:hypothetical protein